MNKFRIVKISMADGFNVFKIQRLKRLFLIGPKVWQSFVDESDNYCWTFFFEGDHYGTIREAETDLKLLINFYDGKKVEKVEVFREYDINTKNWI